MLNYVVIGWLIWLVWLTIGWLAMPNNQIANYSKIFLALVISTIAPIVIYQINHWS